jgi:hypothetical protein
VEDVHRSEKPGQFDEDFVDGLYLGDAIRFFLDAKRAGGRSERTISEYRKKLDLLQRWAAVRLEGEGAVDAPVSWVGPNEVEGYVVHMRGRGLSDTSIKNHLSVVRSFFDTLSRRLDLPDPTRRLDEVRFHQKAPKRTFLMRREADVLLGAMERAAADHEGGDAAVTPLLKTCPHLLSAALHERNLRGSLGAFQRPLTGLPVNNQDLASLFNAPRCGVHYGALSPCAPPGGVQGADPYAGSRIRVAENELSRHPGE